MRQFLAPKNLLIFTPTNKIGKPENFILSYKNRFYGFVPNSNGHLLPFRISSKNRYPTISQNTKKIEESQLFSDLKCNICDFKGDTKESTFNHILRDHNLYTLLDTCVDKLEKTVSCNQPGCKDKTKFLQINGSLAYQQHIFF